MGIAYAVSLIGKPFKMDKLTANWKRKTFARVFVPIAAKQKLATKVPIRVGGKVINLEVEFDQAPELCTVCNRFDHATSKCSVRKNWVERATQPARPDVIQSNNGGPSMM